MDQKQTRVEKRKEISAAEHIGNQAALQRIQENHTGIPDQMKKRAEEACGHSLDVVKVHYQSSLPKEVGALAYTKGTRVYVGPGQEKHLPHELGHVIQQIENRVSPTGSVKGQLLNDDRKLEQEADRFLK